MRVSASAGDKVGFWMYINAVACDYGNGTDGTCKLYVDGVRSGNDILTAYILVPGWNYIPINIEDRNEHTISLDFTLVRGDYKVAFDTIEVNYT